MTPQTTIILSIVIAVVAIAAIALLARSIARGRIKLFGIEAWFITHRPGASANDAKSGRDIKVVNQGPGAATADRAQSDRDLNVENQGPR